MKVKHIFSIFCAAGGVAGNRILAIGCWGVQSSVYLGPLCYCLLATEYRVFLEATSGLVWSIHGHLVALFHSS